MKKSTITLLFWSAVAYAILLLLVRSLLPPDSTPTITLTGIPLIAIAAVLMLDLIRRSTRPADTRKRNPGAGFKASPVQLISSQIMVAAEASNSYFESVVRSRLRDLLVEKAALELGLEKDKVRRTLSDPDKGPRLLQDKTLYSLLYGPAPEKGPARMRMIDEAVESIDAWKS